MHDRKLRDAVLAYAKEKDNKVPDLALRHALYVRMRDIAMEPPPQEPEPEKAKWLSPGVLAFFSAAICAVGIALMVVDDVLGRSMGPGSVVLVVGAFLLLSAAEWNARKTRRNR